MLCSQLPHYVWPASSDESSCKCVYVSWNLLPAHSLSMGLICPVPQFPICEEGMRPSLSHIARQQILPEWDSDTYLERTKQPFQ